MPLLQGGRSFALRRYFIAGAMAVLVAVAPVAIRAEHIRPDDTRIRTIGIWQPQGEAIATLYPGSGLQFRLRGEARVLIESPPGRIALRVLADGVKMYEGVWTNNFLVLDSVGHPATYTILFTAASEEGFYGDASLRFRGMDLKEGASLLEQEPRDKTVRLAFFGDSITAGSVIHGREGEWYNNSDATLSYAYQAAKQLNADYTLRGFPGAQLDEMISVYPFFREGEPLNVQPSPDWVVVNAGANDRLLDEQQYRQKVRELVVVIRSTHPGARVLLLNFFRMTPSRLPDLQRVAFEFPVGEVVCMDARPFLVDYTDGHVHPGPESHRRLATALVDYFRNLSLDSSGSADATTQE